MTGYIDLGNWLVKQWGDHALKVASRLDGGAYTADGVVADTAECAALSAQSIAYIVNEAFDTLRRCSLARRISPTSSHRDPSPRTRGRLAPVPARCDSRDR